MTQKLLYPPRFRRGDPRNMERMRISRMIKRYEKIIRKSQQPAAGVPVRDAGTDGFGVTSA